jgi:hypothetical protein
MNIFFLDWDPKKCAKETLDKHIIKQILESTQLLYSVYHLCDPEKLTICPYTPYKLTHKNHPCAKWVRENLSNFYWLLLLSWEYCKEYTYRYEKIHACQKHIIWMVHNLPDLCKAKITMPAQAMPDKYRCLSPQDPVQAYKNYYIGEKLYFAKYTKREIPIWISEHLKS